MKIPDITNKANLPDNSALLDAGPASVALVAANELKLLYVNRPFEELLGYSKYEMQEGQLSFYALLAEGEAERFELQLALAKNDSKSHNKYGAYKLKPKEKGESLYYVYASVLKGSEDVYHLFILPNLSEGTFPFNSYETRDLFLKHLEKEKYGSFEWFIETGRVFWSDSLYDIYEIEQGLHVNRELIASYTHPDDLKKSGAAVQRAIEDGSKMEVEFKIITGKKNVKVLSVIASVTKDDNGKSVKLAGSVKDITAQRKIEQDLKRKVEELNKSNKELEEFAYVASHDLQEPLRKISTFSDRLSEKYKDNLMGEGSMYLERMMASAENMRILINNLLEYSRVARFDEVFSKVSLNHVMREVKNELELVIEETGTQFEIGSLPEIEGSLSLLTQLFANVISNAIKFRKEDVAPIIKIDVNEVTEEDIHNLHLAGEVKYYKISVVDNGIGFEKEYAEKIFHIFQRLHGKSEYPGSGIGLAICKRIVENHKGALYAESKEGEGASFFIILPVEQNK